MPTLTYDILNSVGFHLELRDFINLHSTCHSLYKSPLSFRDKPLLFKLAVENNAPDKVEQLLLNPFVDFSEVQFKLTQSDLEKIRPEYAHLDQFDFNPLLFSIVKGNIEMALFFMDHPNHQTWFYEAYELFEFHVFDILCSLGHTILVKKLLSSKHNDMLNWNDFQYALGHVIQNNHFETFNLLMADHRITAPNLDVNIMDFQDEGLNDFLGVDELDHGPGINFSSHYNLNMYKACRLGRTMMVSMFLADERIDPSNTMDGRCLKIACENGHLEVVKLLLDDSRNIDPSAFDNEAIKAALKMNHSEVVALLLQDDRVSSTFTLQ